METVTELEKPMVERGALRRWRFADWLLDERSLELRHGGEPVRLHRKPMQVLMHLLQHAGEVVTKDELAAACWPGRILSDTVLTTTINRLRAVLGDGGELVRTVHGFGYRLTANVTVEWVGDELPSAFAFEPGGHPPLRPNWTLVERLGAGGSGEVWRTRHDKTGEERVCKFALDGAALRAIKREITLFRVLKEGLGERPDLARLLDWNLEQAPFFLELEYVPAGSLVQWTEAGGGLTAVPIAQRLALIAQCADALAAAHGVGVLHKDLKPSNVLIAEGEGRPQIKLVDFGSGGVVDAARLAAIGITRLGFTATVAAFDSTSGTPLYLAPEVQAGQPATVQGDLYALGVMLYQAAVGDWRRPLAPGWEREIDDEVLREDIAAAVDGDPARRLADAAELARRLRQLPGRRAQRQAERAAAARGAALQQRLARVEIHRRWMVALAAVLVLGLASTLLLYFKLLGANAAREQARDRAEREAQVAQQVTGYIASLFDAATPGENGGRPIAPRALVDRGRDRLGARFAEQPLVRARVQAALGDLYCKLGLPLDCRQQAEQALALQRQTPGADPLVTAQLLRQLAQAQIDQGLYAEAEGSLREAVALLAAGLPARDAQLADARRSLGQALYWQQKPTESVAVLSAARDALRDAQGRDGVESAAVLGALATSLFDAGAQDEALALAAQQLQLLHQAYGADDLRSVEALDGYASLLWQAGRNAEAEAAQRQVLGAYRRYYGDDSQAVISAKNNLGATLNSMGRVREAARWMGEAVAAVRARGDDDSPDFAVALGNLAQIQEQSGDYAAALANSREAYRLVLAHYGEDHLQTHLQRINLARTLSYAGQSAEAIALLRREIPAGLQGEQVQFTRGRRLKQLADAYVAARDFARAEAALAQAETQFHSYLPAEHWIFDVLAASRARLRLAQHRYAEAVALLQKVVPAYERDEHPESPAVLVAKIDLASALAGAGRGAEARALLEKIRVPVERELLPAHAARAEFARLTGAIP